MKKYNLISEVAKIVDSTRRESEEFVNAIIKAIIRGILKDGYLDLRGFGRFEMKTRKGENFHCFLPKIKGNYKLKNKKDIKFRLSKNLKLYINKDS